MVQVSYHVYVLRIYMVKICIMQIICIDVALVVRLLVNVIEQKGYGKNVKEHNRIHF